MARIAVLGFACALGCGPRPSGGPPPTDSCTSPSAGSVDSVELGGATAADLNSGPSATFTLLHDGDAVSLVRGGQGATMLGFVLRVTGATPPACLAQQTTISDDTGARITASTAPLVTYAEADGSRMTHPFWLPAAYPPTFVVTSAATGQSVSLHLHLF